MKDKNLDNTIEEFYEVLKAHKDDNDNTKELYERIEKLKNKRNINKSLQ